VTEAKKTCDEGSLRSMYWSSCPDSYLRHG